VVTPEPGSGWYSDWWNNGERAGPAWESYYLHEVMPAILSRYRILPQRRYHAIVGVSMGGLGAAYLGGRLPGFFGSVASLSGFVDPQYFTPLTGEGMGLTSLAPLHGDYNLYPAYGPPNGFYANGHNPTDLVMNLAQTRVFESTGTGVPSTAGLKDPIVVPFGSLLESLIIYPMNQVAGDQRGWIGGHDNHKRRLRDPHGDAGHRAGSAAQLSLGREPSRVADAWRAPASRAIH
jgi:S-formylglutathione hydrolase FrmB